MLYDRDYMRSDDGPNFRSPVVLLLIALSFLFLVECIVQLSWRHSLGEWFGLSFAGVAQHQYYRLITFQFLHSAPWPWHILFNGLGLWFFGRSILETHGMRRFWILYMGAGLAGGLVELGWRSIGASAGWTIGASGNVLGLLGAYCLQNPRNELTTFVYFFPFRMRAMTLFLILVGFSVFGLIFRLEGIAHAAHLGGLAAGAAFAKWIERGGGVPDWFQRFRATAEQRKPVAVPAGSVGIPSRKADPVVRHPVGSSEAVSPDEYIRREVDPILDKILAHGAGSLTERERKILEQAPKRLKPK